MKRRVVKNAIDVKLYASLSQQKVARRLFESLVSQRATPTYLLTCITSTFYTIQTSNSLSSRKDLLITLGIPKLCFFSYRKAESKCLKVSKGNAHTLTYLYNFHLFQNTDRTYLVPSNKSEIPKTCLLVRRKQQGECLKVKWSVPTPTNSVRDVHSRVTS